MTFITKCYSDKQVLFNNSSVVIHGHYSICRILAPLTFCLSKLRILASEIDIIAVSLPENIPERTISTISHIIIAVMSAF